ncbi:MAG: nickel pincer cofactor biosynthesis protein LarC [bacterium]|nr:nickel pincer cofactor biosynthesis protein LarC [bacterium]
MKTLYLDCFSGASGDMVVGTLIDLGVDFDALRAALESLAVDGFKVRAEKVNKKSIMATQFTVDVDPDAPQPHRHLRHVLEIIDGGDLPDAVKEASAATFRRIAECEAAVHGTTIEKVHFHEVGAVDSIVDIVGAHLALSLLDVDRVEASPLPLGSGTVTCAHGVIPVPAPATVRLLEGVPSFGTEVKAELVTPTGAALVGDMAQAFGPMPLMRVERVGYGSGTREFEDRANVLRGVIGEADTASGTHPVTVIETNVDDTSAELLGALVADLIEAGARDAFVTPIMGKKGRPAHLITILCDEDKASALAETVFRGSTTFGVRMRREERFCLEREWRTVATPWGPVRVKVGRALGQELVAAPEFDECRNCAEAAGVATRAVYEAAFAAAMRGEWMTE